MGTQEAVVLQGFGVAADGRVVARRYRRELHQPVDIVGDERAPDEQARVGVLRQPRQHDPVARDPFGARQRGFHAAPDQVMTECDAAGGLFQEASLQAFVQLAIAGAWQPQHVGPGDRLGDDGKGPQQIPP